MEVTNTPDSQANCPDEFRWKEETTLGGKARGFCWRIDQDHSLHIARRFANETRWRIGTFPQKKISMIQAYMEPVRWVALANSVSKTPTGDEKDGIGRFIYEEIEADPTTAQLASQIAALFYNAGIWEWNSAKRGMQFKKTPDTNWQQKLTERYNA